MKILFFDLETTGVNPGKNGIHQISGEIIIDGVSKEKFDYKVCPNPAAQIEQSALDVAGVTAEQISKYPPMNEVYRLFVDMLGKYVDKFNRKTSSFWQGTIMLLLIISFCVVSSFRTAITTSAHGSGLILLI